MFLQRFASGLHRVLALGLTGFQFRVSDLGSTVVAYPESPTPLHNLRKIPELEGFGLRYVAEGMGRYGRVHVRVSIECSYKGCFPDSSNLPLGT